MCNGDEDFDSQFSAYGPPNNFNRADFRFDVRNGRFPDRAKFLAHIPAKLRSIIRTCLKPSSADRFQSALDAANALAAIEEKLDWRFSVDGRTKIWKKNENGTKFKLKLFDTGEVRFRRRREDGRPRRITEGCRPEISDRDLQKLLGAY